ncbi:MAG: hypothetical protein IJ576_01210 [Synergistaceae bacterium]|nr:hypothetical protein [Synergistaceae bacterium]MBR1417564.1 hypothetical protein [Synergistaceae bacterium]MBR1602247.1 hypothetical protein [Synergistaceae bacterium]
MKNRSLFILLLILFTLGLIALIFWAVERSSVNPKQSFMMSNVSISIDFEDHQFLAGTISRFEYGTRQVCMRFDYSRLENDLPVRVIWDHDSKRVQAESYTLTAPYGTRIFCLLKEDGSPLPKGSYSVAVQPETQRTAMPKFHFEIY